MADTLYFSRDTKVYVEVPGGDIWEIPVLDGFSFSQATNASEITLNEMTDANGKSRRARAMFNDSYAPAEWSFSTYARPTVDNGMFAIEEPLWALMIGDATTSTLTTGSVATLSGTTVPTFTTPSGSVAADYDGTYTVATVSEDGGVGCTLDVTLTSGTITVALGSVKGSGYTATDTITVSKEVLSAAFGVPVSAVSADLTRTVATITTSSVATFQGMSKTASTITMDFNSSNKAVLGTANMYFVLGGASSSKKVYKISDCCVNEASIDFDIDGIATINWSGFGKLISDEGTSAPTANQSHGLTSTSNFIRNRLTSLVLSNSTYNNTSHSVVLTGGNITISNNMTFLTPETLGVVNQPLGHVTGTRSVSGNFTCYLNGAGTSSAELFSDIIEGTDKVTNNFDMLFAIGGTGNTPRIDLDMNNCHLEVPTHSIEDVISLEVNFHALPTSLDSTDELVITYYGQ